MHRLLAAAIHRAHVSHFQKMRPPAKLPAQPDAKKREKFKWTVRTGYAGDVEMPIVRNPSATDIGAMFRTAPHGDVRALKTPSGDTYVWPANEAMHRDVATSLDLPFRTREELQRGSFLYNKKDLPEKYSSWDDVERHMRKLGM